MLVEIRAGEGGDDAELFATELASAVTAYLRRTHRNAQPSTSPSRTITISAPGPVDPVLDQLTGTHRIQRIPVNDRGGRRHTSTATIAALPDPAGPVSAVVDRADVDIEVFRGSGPGGQHRNKTATNVRVRHRATGKVAVGSSSRSQLRNLEAALADLSDRLASDSQQAAGERVNEARRDQIRSGERAAKQLTWNTQRMTVTDHATGRSWPMKSLLKGHLNLMADHPASR